MASKPSSARGPANRPNPDGALRLAEQAENIAVRDPRRIAASVAMFERLAEHWSLRGDERETLLGGIPKSTWSEWRQRPAFARIKSDTRERIANLFTIDLNAHALFAPEFADHWIREPNAAFAGESPLSTMLRGKVEDVIMVRRYLERIRTSSPSAATRGDSGGAENLAVSYLPGHAVEFSEDEKAVLFALHDVVRAYEGLASKQPKRYRRRLASALDALAAYLDERNDVDAGTVLRRVVEIRRQAAAEDRRYDVDLARSLLQLSGVLTNSGDDDEARSTFAEARDLLNDRLARRERV